jgi:hypothetical protein
MSRKKSKQIEMKTQITIEERIEFIKSIDLPEMPKGNKKAIIFTDDKDSAYVNDGNITGMLGVTNQQKEDLLNSQLLAQLAANKKFDRFTDSENWYKNYVSVLENIAWVLGAFDFKKYQSQSSTFTISEVTITTLLSIITKTSPILKFAEGVIVSIGDEKNKEALLKFSQNSMSSESGNFQALASYIDPELKTLCAAFSGSHFKVEKSQHVGPCSSYESSKITMFASAQILTLDEVIYAKIRKEIIDKLGDRVKQYVSEIEI